MRRGLYVGMSVVALVVLIMVCMAFGSRPWVPNIFAVDSKIMLVSVCCDSLGIADLEDAALLAPGAVWDLSYSDDCETRREQRYTIVCGTPSVDWARAQTSIYMRRIDGWYKAADRGDGVPGWVAMGMASGWRITVNPGESLDVVLGHELNHGLGRWHALMFPWMRRFGVFQNRHVLSPTTRTLGHDRRGIETASPTTYDTDLIDVVGPKHPESR